MQVLSFSWNPFSIFNKFCCIQKGQQSSDIKTFLTLYFIFLAKYPLLFTFMSAAYIQVHFRLDCFMESNNMNHDETAPL